MKDSDKRQFYESIGKKIKRERTLSGINQAELGEKVGISRVSIVNIEKGKQMPPVHVIWKMASALEVPIDRLFPTSDTGFSTEGNVKLIGKGVPIDNLKSIFDQLDSSKNE